MPDAPAAPVAAEPTKIPPPVAAGPQGAAALAEGAALPPAGAAGPVVDDPFEFELDVKGQKQKLKFSNKDQLKAVLQKALYADQVIKDATQARKGAEALIQKLKTPAGIKEVLSDPDVNVDVKRFALEIVQEMMEDEKLTPEQREARDAIRERDQLRGEKKTREEQEDQRKKDEKITADAAVIRGEIIGAMKKYPDIPQTQATMDACIMNMRAAYRRFGKHLTAEQAMAVYSEQYWTSLSKVLDTMTPEQVLARFGQKTLDKIQKLKLNELKSKTNPKGNPPPAGDKPAVKKKHLTEKEFDNHFKELAGGL